VVLMIPSHLSHILQALDKDPFPKPKSERRSRMRRVLPTIPRRTKFNLVHLMQVIHSAAFNGPSSVDVINGFKKTGTWPICPSNINVNRLVKGKGAVHASLHVNLERLAPLRERLKIAPYSAKLNNILSIFPSRAFRPPSSCECVASRLQEGELGAATDIGTEQMTCS